MQPQILRLVVTWWNGRPQLSIKSQKILHILPNKDKIRTISKPTTWKLYVLYLYPIVPKTLSEASSNKHKCSLPCIFDASLLKLNKIIVTIFQNLSRWNLQKFTSILECITNLEQSINVFYILSACNISTNKAIHYFPNFQGNQRSEQEKCN